MSTFKPNITLEDIDLASKIVAVLNAVEHGNRESSVAAGKEIAGMIADYRERREELAELGRL